MADIETLRAAREHMAAAGLNRAARQLGGEIQRLQGESERERGIVAAYNAAEAAGSRFGHDLEAVGLNSLLGRWCAAFYDAARQAPEAQTEPAAEPEKPPRVFRTLLMVPAEVKVRDRQGDVWTFERGGWRWSRNNGPVSIPYSSASAEEYGPFTEIRQ